MEYAEGMQLLRELGVFAPAIVRLGAWHVFSRTALQSSGATIDEALEAGGFIPRPNRRPPLLYIAVGANVLKANEGVAVARSNTVAKRIANALNEYVPGDRGF